MKQWKREPELPMIARMFEQNNPPRLDWRREGV